MWVRRAAISPVPAYAKVASTALERVESELAEENPESQQVLEQAFARFEETQPALSSRIAAILGRPLDETALALGYFLSLAVWMAFERMFAERLGEVKDDDIDATAEAVDLDEELRKNAPDEAVDTDDVVAMEQPDVLEFVRDHIDVALETQDDKSAVDDVDRIYRMLLVEVLALSGAVKPPDQFPAARTEWTA